jgi:ribosome biogenesis GTPase
MRELGMPEASAGLGEAFADVEQYLGQCRFSNCRHETEPGCAIQAAILRGDLARERWESYQKLQRESFYAGNQAAYLLQKRERFKQIAKINKASGKKPRGFYED